MVCYLRTQLTVRGAGKWTNPWPMKSCCDCGQNLHIYIMHSYGLDVFPEVCTITGSIKQNVFPSLIASLHSLFVTITGLKYRLFEKLWE